MILARKFYEQDTLAVARELLGKIVVHEAAEGVTSGRVVETEAYMGPEDKASHAFGNLRTKRTQTQFGSKGHAYIYLIYGMYYCFNVTSGVVPGKPEAVLFRALEPLEGVELMVKRRPTAKGEREHLANGPSRLCEAMGLTKMLNETDLTLPPFCIRDDGFKIPQGDIVAATRIGVDYADEWKHKRWRFYVKDSTFVSKVKA
jgi:DNA-3-methyladenine glycosylase